jgi:hypothetical protein
VVSQSPMFSQWSQGPVFCLLPLASRGLPVAPTVVSRVILYCLLRGPHRLPWSPVASRGLSWLRLASRQLPFLPDVTVASSCLFLLSYFSVCFAFNELPLLLCICWFQRSRCFDVRSTYSERMSRVGITIRAAVGTGRKFAQETSGSDFKGSPALALEFSVVY